MSINFNWKYFPFIKNFNYKAFSSSFMKCFSKSHRRITAIYVVEIILVFMLSLDSRNESRAHYGLLCFYVCMPLCYCSWYMFTRSTNSGGLLWGRFLWTPVWVFSTLCVSSILHIHTLKFPAFYAKIYDNWYSNTNKRVFTSILYGNAGNVLIIFPTTPFSQPLSHFFFYSRSSRSVQFCWKYDEWMGKSINVSGTGKFLFYSSLFSFSVSCFAFPWQSH